MCYSVLGPFIPKEAGKNGASNIVIGMILGCYTVFDLLASLVFGKYRVHIEAKFMFLGGIFVSEGVTILFGVLDQIPKGPVFIRVYYCVFSSENDGCNNFCCSNYCIFFYPCKGFSK